MVEDLVQILLVGAVGVVGRRQVTILPFLGHGSPRTVHVRARVVLGGPAVRSAADAVVRAAGGAADADRTGPSDGTPDAGSAGGPAVAATARERLAGAPRNDRPAPAAAAAARAASGLLARGTWRTLRESVAPFLTVELPRQRVTVRAPAGVTTVRCDRQGYLDVTVDGSGLAPGWNEVTVATSWRGGSTEAQVPVLVVDPAARLALVSDLDDTVIETGITRGLEFLRLTLLTSVTDRTPLPGAAELYRALTAARGGAPEWPVFYLSTSPWNLYELLGRFMLLRGFPTGPLLLTDWGPSRTHLFRVTAEKHKLTLIRALLAEHPELSVVLIGDTGQLDPEIYAAAATEAPDRVRAVYVRRTSTITGARSVEVNELAQRVTAAGVPMLVVHDSLEIAQHAASLGLLDATDVQAVRAATC